MGLAKKILNFFIPERGTEELYDNIMATEKRRYKSEYCRVDSTDVNEVSIDFSGLYSNNGDNVTFYFLVSEMPKELSVNWKKKLRGYCKGTTRLSFLHLNIPHEIDWESNEMKNKLRVLGEVSDEMQDQKVTAYNLHRNLESINTQKWIEESLLYLAEATKERGCGFFETTTLLVISGQRGEDFDNTVREVEKEAQNTLGFKLQRVLYNVPSIVTLFSPFSQTPLDYPNDTVLPSKVLSDEIIARNNVYTQGIVGTSGIYVGTDIFSKFPVLKKIKENDTDAENILITAETGGGKSFLIKVILLQLVALGYNGTIMDIEGNEYTAIANLLSHNSKVHIVNMAEGVGKYFDPVEIPKQIGNADVDSTALSMSTEFTKQILGILLGGLLQEDTWYTIILDEAISQTYIKAGVKIEDNTTWELSSVLTLHDVYRTIKEMHGKFKKDNEEVQKMIDKAITKLGAYFEPNGIKASMFKNRVHISEVASADLVICSFGMAGRAENSIDPVQMALMQLSAAMFSHQRSLYSKAQGKYNFKVWEEFQRWGGFPGSDKTIGVAITGGRKLGDVNIIISNNVKDLLDNDRFKILGNLQSKFIGSIPDSEVRHNLLRRLDLLAFEDELTKITKDSIRKEVMGVSQEQVHTVESIYKHAFLISLDNAYHSIVKVKLPVKIAKSSLFHTGVNAEEDFIGTREKMKEEQKKKQTRNKTIKGKSKADLKATDLLKDIGDIENIEDIYALNDEGEDAE